MLIEDDYPNQYEKAKRIVDNLWLIMVEFESENYPNKYGGVGTMTTTSIIMEWE